MIIADEPHLSVAMIREIIVYALLKLLRVEICLCFCFSFRIIHSGGLSMCQSRLVYPDMDRHCRGHRVSIALKDPENVTRRIRKASRCLALLIIIHDWRDSNSRDFVLCVTHLTSTQTPPVSQASRSSIPLTRLACLPSVTAL